MIDVIVPTVTGREDSLERCLDSYRRNTHPSSLNFIVIRDEPTCGGAWLKGMEQSTAPYVHLTCDDLEMTSSTWAGVCVDTADEGLIPCPVVRRPDGSLESCGGDLSRADCLISTMQPDRTPVDFTVVPFGSREQVEAIGMIATHYLTDTYFSRNGRRLGYETVVRHGYEFTHHHEAVGRKTGPTPDERRVFDRALM